MTNRYQIENTLSGVVFGVYEGDTEAEALDALARDAGYRDNAEVELEHPSQPGEILVTEIHR